MRNVTVFVLLLAALHTSSAAMEHVKRDEVKPGLKGYGLSVFSGTKPEKFEFELIGNLKNVFPTQDIIICRIKHPVTDKAGVIAGMSGSPLYVVDENGGEKLLGALAYGWSFQKEPIAGITPAYNMLDRPLTGSLAAGNGAAAKVQVPRTPELKNFWPGAKAATPVETSQPGFPQIMTPVNDSSAGSRLRPLATPIHVSGASPAMMNHIRTTLGPAGFLPLEGPGGGEVEEKPLPAPEDNPFKPGDTIGVQLMSGDMDWTASGTVTWVDGAKVYAYGHRFMDAGPVKAPVTTGEVITVIASQQSSFKLTQAKDVVGSLVFDHLAAIEAQVGLRARTIPVSVTGRIAGTEEERTFNYRVSEVPGMWPSLSAYALWDSTDKMLPYGNPCRVRSRIELKLAGADEAFVFNEVSMAGQASPPVYSLWGILGKIEYNPYSEARVEYVKVSMEVDPGRHFAKIEKVVLPLKVYEEETFTVQVHLKPFGVGPDETEVVEMQLTAPSAGKDTVLKVTAAPAAQMYPPQPRARTLEETLRNAANVPSREVLRLVTSVSGVRGAGASGMMLRYLPGTAVGALGDEAGVFVEGRETDKPVKYVLGGGASAVVEVVPR